MGGGWFPKLVWPKHNMLNQQVKVGVANNDKRAKCWYGTGKVGVATATPAIRHSPPMIVGDHQAWVAKTTRNGLLIYFISGVLSMVFHNTVHHISFVLS